MIREWLALLGLARRRFRSDADYRRFQAYQGSLVVDYLLAQGISLRRSRVLDLACGHGGYSEVLRQAGAQVIAFDLNPPKVLPPIFVIGDALCLPFASGSLPLVFCASLIEHVSDPVQLLVEIKRVLVPGGLAYLSFPPFYSPGGGHQFKPYHLLGERWALRLTRSKASSFATCYGDWGLYPMTVKRARRMIAKAGLRIRHESTRFLPLNVARIPILGEFLCWHIQFILSHEG